MAISFRQSSFALLAIVAVGPAFGADLCATPEQIQKTRTFFGDNPGTLPPIAARRLELPEAVAMSALDGDTAQSAKGDAFQEVWAAMSDWENATFLIMKGANVFEISSGVGKGAPSQRSDYFNIEYTHPLRGHLRPDLYSSIYAVTLQGEEGPPARGVLFYDQDGASVFGTFISGENVEPGPEDVAKFERVWNLIKDKPGACR